MTMMVAVVLLLCSGPAVWATNIQFSRGPEIVEREIEDNTIIVRFSLGWDNSWNLNSPPNHDAAWIFMKYRKLGHDGFHHANLHQVDHIVMGTDGNGAGSTRHNVEYGMSPVPHRHDAAVGVFLSRSDISVGSNVFENVELHWDIEHTGIDENTVLSVRVFAIEMVFIPHGQFRTGLTNAAPLTDFTTGQPVSGAAMHPQWPLGNNPFYIMKHEVTQHAWVDFLNSLTLEQQMARSFINPASAVGTQFANRPASIVAGGHTITQDPLTNSRMFIQIRQSAVGNRPAVFGLHAGTTGAQHWDHEQQGGNLPMFGLNWHDVMAYLDWAGLRPLTEFEYEKAARGTLQVIDNEFAWGNATIGTAVLSFDDRNRATEVSGTGGAVRSTPSDAAIAAHNATSLSRWPIRVGAFARDNTSRVEAGASFWGVMNLTDNVPERFVRFDVEAGRVFRGTHGDGNLTGDGFADVADWPSAASRVFTTANNTGAATHIGSQGTIYRGIGLSTSNNIPAWAAATFGVGARGNNHSHGSRDPWTGARGGRSVPIELAVLVHPSIERRGAVLNNVGATVGGAFTEPHRLRVAAIGGTALTIQWYWTEEAVPPGDIIMGGTPATGGQGVNGDGRGFTFLPPFNEAHGPRFFFARMTDEDGTVITTNQSGSFSVMAVDRQPSTTPVTITSLTSGTVPLVVQPEGGTPPFYISWHILSGTNSGQAGNVGTVVSDFTLLDTTHWPTVPIPLTNYVFFASIRDATGSVVRSHFSGVHRVNDGEVWFGPGVGTTTAAWSTQQPTTGATGQIHSITLEPGTYRLEAWGGTGGRGQSGNAAPSFSGPWGMGGYAQMIVRFTVPTTLYVVPGGSGTNSGGAPRDLILPGGFNGGGRGAHAMTGARHQGGGSGGGASHISLASGTIDQANVRHLDSIIIVAGGGGGHRHGCCCGRGGPGGGGVGTNAPQGGSEGGQAGRGGNMQNMCASAQGTIFHQATSGGPGIGGDGSRGNQASWGGSSGGGGGGWFGGAGGNQCCGNTRGGSGGSGFINTARFGPTATGVPAALLPHQGRTAAPPLSWNPMATGGIEQPGAPGNCCCWRAQQPRHPSVGTTNQTPNQILGGAVRIMRLQ